MRARACGPDEVGAAGGGAGHKDSGPEGFPEV